jgi:hypothetical protein
MTKNMTDPKEALEQVQELIQTWSAPYREAQSASDLQAIEFAKFLIQSLLLLHGGAMVAVPAFAQLLPSSVNRTAVLGVLVGLFAVGLVASACAGLLGFLALGKRSDGNGTLINAVVQRAWAHVLEIEHRATGDAGSATASAKASAEAAAISAKAEQEFRCFRMERRAAIFAVFVSVAALIGAAAVAILAILNNFSIMGVVQT